MVGARLRAASGSDAEILAAIRIASRLESIPQLVDDHDRDAAFWTNRWRGYLTEGSRAQFSLGDGFAFVAEMEVGPVGFAAWHHTTRHGAEAELESLYVLRPVQGLGVGTRLLWRVGARLLAEGSRTMCVGYDPLNPFKRFYLKHGAVEIDPHWAIWRDLNRFAGEPAG